MPISRRRDGRRPDALRPLTIRTDPLKFAAGSVLIAAGDTQLLCSASLVDGVPPFLTGKGRGWLTAEYAMLPASTGRRTPREVNGRKGRTQEIQRLIGRSLRTVVNMRGLGGEYTVTVDCDVIQADGGTRTASITGAWVALYQAMDAWMRSGRIHTNPVTGQVAAVSIGVVDGRTLLDLDYPEDSHADVDMNVVMDATGRFIEIQGTGEKAPFSRERLGELLDTAEVGIGRIQTLQRQALGLEAGI